MSEDVRVPLAVLLGFLVLAAPAHAGSADQPEISDPAGDVQHLGVPAAAGFDWGDLTSAWFSTPEDGTLLLSIRVKGTTGPPAQGEIGVTFRVGSQYFIAGYTVFPPLYSGGFLSPADENGDVPANVDPANANGTWSANGIEVEIPIQSVDPNGTQDRVASPAGWSESRATNGRMYRLDETAQGTEFVWSLAAAADGTVPPSSDGPPATPGPSAWHLIAGIGALAVVRRRTRPA